MSKLNLTEHVYSQAHKKQRTELKQQQTRLTRKCKTVKYFDLKKRKLLKIFYLQTNFVKKASYIYVLDYKCIVLLSVCACHGLTWVR